MIEKTVERPRIVEKVVDRPVERILEKMVQTPVLIEKVIEKPVEYVQERIVEKPIETIVERIVERPVYKEVEKIVDKVVEKIVEIVVEKPVIVHKFVEKPVEKIVERYGETTRTVTHQAKGKASEVKAKFLGAKGDIGETEWVERSTGIHPEDDFVGDESAQFLADDVRVVEKPSAPEERRPRHGFDGDPKKPRS